MNFKNELIVGFISLVVILILSGMSILQYAKDSRPPMYPTPQNAEKTSQTTNMLSATEVAKHLTSSDCYLIIDQKVYDVTNYLSQHPGGAFRIIPYCGQDATQAFMTKGGEGQHSSKAVELLGARYVGDLSTKSSGSTPNQSVTTTAAKKSTESQGSTLTIDEIAKHKSESDCWLIIDNKVYDATSYISQHPGGAQRIITYCGQDATQAFMTKGGRGTHSSTAQSDLSTLYIGDLNQTQVKQVDTKAVQSLPVRGESEDDD